MKHRYIDFEAVLDDVANNIDWEDKDVLEACIEGLMCHIRPTGNLAKYRPEYVSEIYNKCGYFTLPLKDYVFEVEED